MLFRSDAATLGTDELDWDGLDAFGVPVAGITPATIRVGHAYGVLRIEGGNVTPFDFALPRTGISSTEARGIRYTRWSSRTVPVAKVPSLTEQTKLGVGWDVSLHHALSPRVAQIWYGDGPLASG